ncbi:MAG: hypothetical protein QW667_08040 [Candidatus Bathyarchaeia archaeon]
MRKLGMLILPLLVVSTILIGTPLVSIAQIATAYGSSIGDLRYKPEYDLNKDGTINIIDMAITAKNFGKTY